ncbi:pentapeptide repeat-containing protein [Mycetocola tolaasinivorans]|uniref:Pentapeptide repeat-containing protein n=1 Tax=Mycetocola tolaasinivorans TaxID=76635 RepID=A0A3L7A3M4_9MICO|nr:pentapeptide repeat-containing protein [Mycetocola tolaasinivorans]RLP74540.1 pentapeptide repeat-containing protein [Mycetocola tolaasinivorans]
MARPGAVRAPLFDPPPLEHLEVGLESELRAGERLDSLRFTGVDVSEQNLVGLDLTECEFLGGEFDGTDLRGLRAIDTRFDRINAPVLKIPRSTLREVRIESSRFGSAEAYDAGWESVHLIGCKIGYLNLRGSTLTSLQFTDCTIDELDLGGATVTRLAFPGTTVQTLDLTAARLTDADLRGLEPRVLNGIESLAGATMTEEQFSWLAPLLATHLGVNLTA